MMFEIFHKIMRVSLNEIKQFYASDLCEMHFFLQFFQYI